MSRYKYTAWPLCLIWPGLLISLADPSFEVASVKRRDLRDQSYIPHTCENNRFTSRGSPLLENIAWAYDLRFDQFLTLEASLPSWARTEIYDFEAVANERMATPQCKQAIQGLFVDRFKMKAHWKKVPNAPVYELRVPPKGHKLKPVSTTDTGCGVHIAYEGQERPCDRYAMPFAPKRAMSMTELAKVLSIYTSQYPVRDLTGLSGEYKINLSFTRRDDHNQYLPLEKALQEQLGLELRLSKGDLEVLIVDSIDRPTSN